MNPATWPREDRLGERLLTIDPATGALADHRVKDLPALLRPGDLLVVNDAATLPASLAMTTDAGAAVEVRLAGRRASGRFHAVLFGAGDWHDATTERPAPPALAAGARLIAAHGAVTATVAGVSPLSPRLVELAFALDEEELYAALWAAGRPVQYWYLEDALDAWHVQTAFAGRPWAVEMPSAGRPLSLALLVALRRAGVGLAAVTHAAGLSATGDEALDAALPLPELCEVSGATVRAVERTRAAGGRVLAAGTSVVRALEGVAALSGRLASYRGEVALRIRPGFVPQVVDGLLTGMHAAGESHYELLGAFAPGPLLDRASAHADAAGYLCHEFGDSTLIAGLPRAA